MNIKSQTTGCKITIGVAIVYFTRKIRSHLYCMGCVAVSQRGIGNVAKCFGSLLHLATGAHSHHLISSLKTHLRLILFVWQSSVSSVQTCCIYYVHEGHLIMYITVINFPSPRRKEFLCVWGWGIENKVKGEVPPPWDGL